MQSTPARKGVTTKGASAAYDNVLEEFRQQQQAPASCLMTNRYNGLCSPDWPADSFQLGDSFSDAG